MNEIIDNSNFMRLIKSMKSKNFTDIEYIIEWGSLSSKNKKYLEDHDIPKSRLTILTPNPKNVPQKFKHQIEVENKKEKPRIDLTLKHLFLGKQPKNEILKELENFDNRHILLWLESTASVCPQLIEVLSEVDKYVYSKFFKSLVAYKLSGIRCIPYYQKR